MDTLARRPDAVLVAAETVHDFQLQRGDLIRLRLQHGHTKQYKTVPFHYAGVAKEFPTRPTDSFLVANADYVARATDSIAVGTFLVPRTCAEPAALARRMPTRSGTSRHAT